MPSPIHNKMVRNQTSPASVQQKLNGKGDSGPGKQAKDGRANTNAGGFETKVQPWFESDPSGSIKKWPGAQ